MAAPALAAGPEAVAHPGLWAAGSPDLLKEKQVEAFVADLLGRMSLEDKVGQMIQADISAISPADLAHYRLGSILAGGLSAPGGDIHASPKAWLDLVEAYKAASLSRAGATPAIPILFGIDAVHGNARIPGATVFPHNVALGAMHDPALLERIGDATAQEVAATGIDWAFAPTLAVVRDVRWGRSYESYSDDPALVARYAASMVTGLQGQLHTKAYLAPGHVIASAKHFLGDGGTADGRDQGNNPSPEATLRDVHGAGYPAAIAAGVATVMASYNGWNGVKMHANESLLTGVLKQRWAFDGFVISDWNAQEELPGCTKFSCPESINAGVDMVMAPDGWKQQYANLLQQARSGAVPAARIDDAVRRILRVKALAGLLGPLAGRPNEFAGHFDLLGSAAHRAIARQAVRESLVLLKNDGNLLPLAPGQTVLVAGEAADRIGEQCGAWTVDWQGAHNSNADIPGATSIFAGIRQAVEAAGGHVILSEDGAGAQHADVAIVVFGEHPYAEFEGDRENLLPPDEAKNLALLERLRARHIPVVTVFLSGRPLWVNREINRSTAFVAAWLPGSEGEGVADLLFRAPGGKTPAFTGRLSFPWPATAMPVRYDADGTVSGALFPRGYGLAAETATTAHTLPEDPAIPAQWNVSDRFYAEGHVIAPWSVYVSDHAAQVRLTQREQASPGGIVTVRQAGAAIAAEWSGKGNGLWFIGDKEVDYTKGAGRSLTLRYTLASAPTAPVLLGEQCGQHCGGMIDITQALKAGGMQTLSIGLGCFAKHGVDLSHVSVPLALETSGALSLSISEAGMTKGAGGDFCPK